MPAVLLTVVFILSPCVIFPWNLPKSCFERVETGKTSPFGPYRERSTQRVVYNHVTPYLVSEFDFKHSVFCDYMGFAPTSDRLYQASFSGRNLSNALEFKAGRIWCGSDRFRAMDGVSLRYPWGRRLSTTLDIGKSVDPELKNSIDSNDLSQAHVQYRFNRNTVMSVTGGREYEGSFTSTRIGYQMESLLLSGEYCTTSGTDTCRLGLQYYDGTRFDLTSDYRLNVNRDTNSGALRNTFGIDAGSLYFELSAGGAFYYGGEKLPDNAYYEGTVTWGDSGIMKDTLSLGYLMETSPASSAKTISAQAERRISRNTFLNLGLSSSRLDEGKNSIQNIESILHRRVDWGYFELGFALINGANDETLQKEIRLRAGYHF